MAPLNIILPDFIAQRMMGAVVAGLFAEATVSPVFVFFVVGF